MQRKKSLEDHTEDGDKYKVSQFRFYFEMTLPVQ